MKKRLLLIFIFALAILFVSPFIGMKSLDFSSIFNANLDSDIFWKIRLPRVLTAFIAGAGLAVSGMIFQAMFRNRLATPFTLGVSSGAGFGAALAVKLSLTFVFLGISAVSLFAFLGALLSVFIVYTLAGSKKGFNNTTILLAGVAVNFSFASLIMFIQYLSDHAESHMIIHWLMGSLDVMGYDSVIRVFPIVAAGGFAAFYMHRELDLLSFSDEMAISRGVNVKKVQKTLFFITSLMVGGVVAVAGPIAFVGMMAPHICRMLIGGSHRYLVPATLFFGGGFLVVCDTFSRTFIAPAEIPVGVITSLLGGPFFLWLLVKKRV